MIIKCNIKNESSFLDDDTIIKIEDHYNATYVFESCLKDVYDGWANFPVAIFYTEEAHPQGSNYFGLYKTEDGTVMITNGIKATEQPFSGVMAKNGDVIYSRYRHDHRTSDDGSVFVDGGRDYFRSGVYAKEQYVSLRVNKDKLEAFKDEQT
jgi:hypothetical protein